MLEIMSSIFAFTEDATLLIEKNEKGQCYAMLNVSFPQIDEKPNFKRKLEFEAKNIFELFNEIETLFPSGQDCYTQLRDTCYGLNAFNELYISNQGECFATSDSNKIILKERYDYHMNMEKFLNSLHKNVLNPDYTSGIVEDITK